MVSTIQTVTFNGIDVNEVEVQVQIAFGDFAFNIVGLPDKIIAESKERIRAALNSIAIALPCRRILVNLSPADLMKEGSHFDLPITACLLAALNILPESELQKYVIIGELALNAKILPVNGVLPAAVGANRKDLGIICPAENGKEAAWSGNTDILAPDNLLTLINHFKGTQQLSAPKVDSSQSFQIKHKTDFSEVQGQETAKRALEIAAAGGHNLLMIGPPGTGKSMLASCLPSILPQMTANEVLDTSMIYSIAGDIKNGQLISQRPFRAPHHSSSMAAMIGGGHSKRINPGEISLAHNGVLFLDEFPEFPRAVIDALRQPIETKEIAIARAQSHVTYPADFQLIAALNHCKCGYFLDTKRCCKRVPECANQYQNKISGPILDRIDIFIEITETPKFDSSDIATGESSNVIAKRVQETRQIQIDRYKEDGILNNSQLNGSMLTNFASLDAKCKELLNKFANNNSISFRSYHRIIKVARTIADLEKAENIQFKHVAEAIGYKSYFH